MGLELPPAVVGQAQESLGESSGVLVQRENNAQGELSPQFMQDLTADLRFEEGFRTQAYLDTKGILSIGTGVNVVEYERRTGVRLAEKVGDEGDPEALDEAERGSVEVAINDARSFLNNFNTLDSTRKRAVVGMSYQLGGPRLGKFVDFKAAMEAGHFDTAADEVMDSKAGRDPQLRGRFQRTSDAIRYGGQGTLED